MKAFEEDVLVEVATGHHVRLSVLLDRLVDQGVVYSWVYAERENMVRVELSTVGSALVDDCLGIHAPPTNPAFHKQLRELVEAMRGVQ